MSEDDHPPTAPKTSLMPLVAAGVFMLVGILLLIYVGRDTSMLLNAPMPDTDLRPLLSTDFKPSGEAMRGEIVVYHFWGTWCPPCRAEYPEFYSLYEIYRDQAEVRFISVSCDAGFQSQISQLHAETEHFLQQRKMEMPIYADPAGFTRVQIAKQMAAGGFEYPMTIVVDQQGVVREFWRGPLKDMTELKSKIDQLIKHPAQPT